MALRSFEPRGGAPATDSNRPDRNSLQSGPDVKKMILINNGDKLSRGRPFLFNEKKVSNWENLMLEFSDHLRPAFGLVRKVYTPRQGTEITRMDQLEQNGVYVLSGTEKFKPIPNGYNTETVINQHFNHVPKQSIGGASIEKGLPIQFSGTDVPDLRKSSLMILNVNVFRNGDDVNPPTKVMLKKFDLWNILRAKDVIAEKVKPIGGFCKSLRTLDGNAIKHVADLKNGGYYVAVGPYEKFRHADYSPEGRPIIVVPMKQRSSFTANTYQDPDGQKRRRTFVVRLKKNEQDRFDETEENGFEDETITGKNQDDRRDSSQQSQHTRAGSRTRTSSKASRISQQDEDNRSQAGSDVGSRSAGSAHSRTADRMMQAVEEKQSLALGLPISRLGLMNTEKNLEMEIGVSVQQMSEHSLHSLHSHHSHYVGEQPPPPPANQEQPPGPDEPAPDVPVGEGGEHKEEQPQSPNQNNGESAPGEELQPHGENNQEPQQEPPNEEESRPEEVQQPPPEPEKIEQGPPFFVEVPHPLPDHAGDNAEQLQIEPAGQGELEDFGSSLLIVLDVKNDDENPASPVINEILHIQPVKEAPFDLTEQEEAWSHVLMKPPMYVFGIVSTQMTSHAINCHLLNGLSVNPSVCFPLTRSSPRGSDVDRIPSEPKARLKTSSRVFWRLPRPALRLQL
ncbi:putative Doublecortin domain-containing protein 2C [Hypsibius exemplaris]|uniref:Doublecortin domain-containing protein 2C n=1 Tax=Hypsibius exemplaris TaxID=2072580 RepID=A0A1W0X086_HYPEX|nr:putative Doublecortin domain-containing protein 2C [Hypsibius exemplaris]